MFGIKWLRMLHICLGIALQEIHPAEIKASESDWSGTRQWKESLLNKWIPLQWSQRPQQEAGAVVIAQSALCSLSFTEAVFLIVCLRKTSGPLLSGP